MWPAPCRRPSPGCAGNRAKRPGYPRGALGRFPFALPAQADQHITTIRRRSQHRIGAASQKLEEAVSRYLQLATPAATSTGTAGSQPPTTPSR